MLSIISNTTRYQGLVPLWPAPAALTCLPIKGHLVIALSMYRLHALNTLARSISPTFQVAVTWSSRRTHNVTPPSHSALLKSSLFLSLALFASPELFSSLNIVSRLVFTSCSRCSAPNLLYISTLAQDSHGRSTSRYPHQTSIRSTRKQPATLQKQAQIDVTPPEPSLI